MKNLRDPDRNPPVFSYAFGLGYRSLGFELRERVNNPLDANPFMAYGYTKEARRLDPSMGGCTRLAGAIPIEG